MIEKQTGKQIKRLRTDNGMEFCEGDFEEFCKNEGIVRHRTIRMTPQQNGVAERMNRTLLERARCMISNAGLTKDFWAEAINMACYVVNRAPSAARCPAYMHINEGKLEPELKSVFSLDMLLG